ncbi:thiamine pyrophosphate-binding protein [Amycolatopsis pittospori]|uniref:thiamine pyrophosphate-binding protein n=1 Tax=Amycolatopsis pittospori TaxID=2749434 RepID=UPI0015F0B88D|nr:thiamine pyrophosphate-binding protein [Amycolatopsis pittospori]
MTTTAHALEAVDVAHQLCHDLTSTGFGPFFGTPCGILAPLYRALDDHAGLLTVAREDNAVGIAAGAVLAGRHPVVLMQNSGLGQSVNALASLVEPYRLGMLLIISLRGVDPDPTQENLVMGRLTEPLLAGLGVATTTLGRDQNLAESVGWAADVVQRQGRTAALLVPPPLFGWHA